MTNGEIIEKGGKKRMYLNGCFVIHDPFTEEQLKNIFDEENIRAFWNCILIIKSAKNGSINNKCNS